MPSGDVGSTNKGDAATPFIRARVVAQESKRVSELTPEDSSSTFAATPPLESLKVMLSRCMTGKRRTLAEGAHFYSPAHRTIVIKVAKEDHECTSGCAVLDNVMYGTKDTAQCLDVASENAMTARRYDTGKFSPCLYHSSAVAMSVFRHGDDIVVSGTRTQQKEFEETIVVQTYTVFRPRFLSRVVLSQFFLPVTVVHLVSAVFVFFCSQLVCCF